MFKSIEFNDITDVDVYLGDGIGYYTAEDETFVLLRDQTEIGRYANIERLGAAVLEARRAAIRERYQNASIEDLARRLAQGAPFMEQGDPITLPYADPGQDLDWEVAAAIVLERTEGPKTS